MPPVPRIDQGLRGAGAVPGRSLCVQRAVLLGGGHPLQPPLQPCHAPAPPAQLLTLHGEEHGLADVRAHPVAGLAQVVADVLLQHVADEQGAVGEDLDAARQRDGVVLLRVPTSWEGAQTCSHQSSAKQGGFVGLDAGLARPKWRDQRSPNAAVLPLTYLLRAST